MPTLDRLVEIELEYERLEPLISSLMPGCSIMERSGVTIFPIYSQDGSLSGDMMSWLEYKQPERRNYTWGFDPFEGDATVEQLLKKAVHAFREHLTFVS